jgi:hypothetical protein
MTAIKDLKILSVLILMVPVCVFGDITYTLHLDGVDAGIRDQIEGSIAEAVGYYNQYGSFNKHLNIYYSAGVPTAQANFDGVMTFGGSRNSRVAMHEITHTLGCGTYWAWGNLMVNGVWNGAYATAQVQEFDGAGALLRGDSIHFWPYGLNYDNEDGFIARIRQVRMVASLAADMGFLSFVKEPTSLVLQHGATAVFTVEAANSQSYQWYKQGQSSPLTNGGNISGANTKTLQIANVSAADVGRYYCRISGELSSRSAGLMVPTHVGHWDFGNNSLDTLGMNHGTVFGGAVYAAGKIGRAIDLDGTDDFVRLPAGVADAVDITVAAWVNWDGGSDWQRIFDFGNNTNQYLFLTPRSGGNTLRFVIKNGGGEQMVETTALATGQWVHVAVTLSGTTATLYVNGTAAATNNSVTINPIDFAPTVNYIGDSQFRADPLFKGCIDEIHIYSYALTSAEISAIYAGRAAFPSPAESTFGVRTQLCLTWEGGYSGESAWQTYLGTSQAAVNGATPASAEYLGVRYQEQLSTPMLLPNTTYYWRVDPLLPEGTVVKGNVWMFVTGGMTEALTPKFAGYVIDKPDATEGIAYTQSLAGDVVTAGPSSFQKLAGPEWIAISPDGVISGTPPEGAAGQALCTVRIADEAGYADEAVVSLLVRNIYSGRKGYDELGRFAEEWLFAGPAFYAADLNQDEKVDLVDWSLFAADWNYESESGLAAAWTMDDAFGEMVGDALGRYPGTLRNMNALWRPMETIVGKTSHCLAFDGVDDYVEISDYKGISGGASRTCTAWIKTTRPSTSYILNWGAATDEGAKWLIRLHDDGGLRVSINGGTIRGVSNLADGDWHHIAVVLEDDGSPDVSEVELYADGRLETVRATTAHAVNTSADQTVKIGVDNNTGTVFFLGQIDDVRIYERALSGREIAEMADAVTVAYWRFEEGPVNASVSHGGADSGVFYPGVSDSSGHGNHLSVFAEGWAGYTYRHDVSGSTLQDSGAVNALSVQNSGSYPAMFTGSEAMRTMTPAAFTIEVSFKPETGGFRTLVGRDSYGAIAADPAAAALYLQITPSNAIAIKFADKAGTWHVAQSADGVIQGFVFPNAAQGLWYHAAAVSDGTLLSLYLADVDAGGGYTLAAQTDMTLSGSTNTALTAGLGSGSDWQAGNWSVGRGLHNGGHTDRAFGFIDEVRISSQALLPSQFLYVLP